MIACQISRCSDPEHQSLARLEDHINKCHLNFIHTPCPALSCLYTAAASQGHQSHLLSRHTKLLPIDSQSHTFKPLATPLAYGLYSPAPLPTNSRFPSYKLVTNTTSKSVGKGLNSLTKSISSLKVSQSSDKPKQQMVQRLMASSTPKCHTSELDKNSPKYIFTDLSSIDTLHVQQTHNLSNPLIYPMLSAPPPWKLDVDRPIGTPQTVGYNVFFILHE